MKQLFLILFPTVFICIAGCTPEIEKIQVTTQNGQPPAHGQEVRVEIYVTPKIGGARKPKLSIKPLLPQTQHWENAGTLTDREEIGPIQLPVGNETITFKGYLFSGSIPKNLEYGGYSLKVTVPYMAWLRTLTISDTLNFLVEAPSPSP